jgi:hypothetical protein
MSWVCFLSWMVATSPTSLAEIIKSPFFRLFYQKSRQFVVSQENFGGKRESDCLGCVLGVLVVKYERVKLLGGAVGDHQSSLDILRVTLPKHLLMCRFSIE